MDSDHAGEAIMREVKYHGLSVSAALIAALLIAPSLIRPQESFAASASTFLHVHAVVLPRASVNVLVRPPKLAVTEEDIARGFVEIPATTVVEVKSNHPAGFLLTFSSHGLLFEEVLIRGLERNIVLGPDGGLVKLSVKGRLMMTLGYRFVLAPGTQQGVYEWPITLAAGPF